MVPCERGGNVKLALNTLPTSSSLSHSLTHSLAFRAFLPSFPSFSITHSNFVSFIIWGDTLPHKTQNPFCSVTRDSDSRRHRKSRTKATFTDSLAIRFFSVFLSLSLSLSVTVRVYCFFIYFFILISCTAILISCFGGGFILGFGFGFN